MRLLRKVAPVLSHHEGNLERTMSFVWHEHSNLFGARRR